MTAGSSRDRKSNAAAIDDWPPENEKGQAFA